MCHAFVKDDFAVLTHSFQFLRQHQRAAFLAFRYAAFASTADVPPFHRGIAQHLGVFVRILLLPRRIDDLQRVVGDDRAGVFFAVNGVQLGDGLDNRKQADVVARHIADGMGDDFHPAYAGKFVHQQQALVLQVLVVLRQLFGVLVDELGKEQVDDDPRFGKFVGQDADIDGHFLFAYVGQQEIVGGSGSVNDGVDPRVEWFFEGAHDGTEGFLFTVFLVLYSKKAV